MSSQSPQTANQVVTFVIPPADPTILITQSAQPDGSKAPVHAIKISKDSKPQVQLAAFAPSADGLGRQVPIGSATVRSMSESIELQLHGNSMKMSHSSMSSDYSFRFPPTGKLTWKHGGLSGGALKLVDDAGTRIATYNKGSLFGGGAPMIEVWVPCVPQFLDLIVLSAMALAQKDKKNSEMAKQFVEVLGGMGA